MKNKNRIYIVLVILLISIIAGMSYALWQITRTQTDKNIVTTGCFEVTTDLGTEDEQSPISIENAYPILDSEGKTLAPFTFTITNTCDVYAGYQINLETLSATTLNKDYVKVSLNNVGPGILSSFDSVDPTITGATTSNKLTTGGLKAGASKTFNLRLWMDQDTPMSEGQNKTYQGKISIVTSPSKDPTPVNPCTYDGELVQGAEYTDGTYTYKYMQEATSSGWQDITEDGWGVKLTDSTATEVNSPICTSINDKPIVSMSRMFYNANDLTAIDVLSFDTSQVVRMSYMFFSAGNNSSSFEIVGLDNFDTSSVTDMSNMFNNTGLNTSTFNIGDLSGWDTSNVTSMKSMFQGAGKNNATTFNIGDLSGWDTSNVTSMRFMFYGAGKNATTWNIGNLSNWNTSNVTDMAGMFDDAGYGATTFSLDLSKWNTSNVTTMLSMFYQAGYNATTWSIGDLSKWNTTNVTSMNQMFYGAGYNATNFNLNLSNWSISTCSRMFLDSGYNSSNFELNLTNWDTSNVTIMQQMFYQAGYNSNVFTIKGMDTWNVSNVTDMSAMFNAAGYSATIWNIGDLSNWDTSKVTTMANMFDNAGYSATTWNSIGTLKVYASSLYEFFIDCSNAKATVNIYNNPSIYDNAFSNAATKSGSGITVNYSSATTNIDAIIATKSSNSNVVKGVQLD